MAALSTIIPAITPTASPTATPPAITASTANWKTYENENHGYSIKYPKDWIEAGASYKQGNDDVVLHSPSTVQSFNNPIVTEAISDFQILYYDSAQRLPDIANDNKISGAKSLLEYLKAQKAKPDLGVDYRSAKIGQYDGYSVDEPNIGNIQFYYLENKGHIYKFMLNDDRAELKQILTTFQFTK